MGLAAFAALVKAWRKMADGAGLAVGNDWAGRSSAEMTQSKM
jgi:hypothetical protein